MTTPTDSEIAEGIAEVYTTVVLQTFQALRQRIPELNHPRLCPERFVDWLAAKVGLSKDVPLAARLSVDDLRRLIPSLISVWREWGAGKLSSNPLTRGDFLSSTRCLYTPNIFLGSMTFSIP